MAVRSLHDFFKGAEEKEVWVQNVSSPQGNITITIDSVTGQSTTIPKGSDPVPMTERFTFEQLKKSNDLRQLVESRKVLVLLTQEEAAAYYKKKGKDRYDKVTKRQENLESKMVNDALTTNQSNEAKKSDVANILNEFVPVEETQIPPKVVSLESEYNNKVITDVEYTDELKAMESDLLNDETIAFIGAKTKNSKVIKAYVKELQKLLEEKNK